MRVHPLKSLFFVSCLFLGMGCGAKPPDQSAPEADSPESGSQSGLSEIFSDPITLSVLSGTSHECMVYGEEGRLLGSGPAASVSYEVGAEEAVIIECGDRSAVVEVGADSIQLSSATSRAAELLKGGSMGEGSLLIASLISELEDSITSLSTSSLVKLVADAPLFDGDIVQEALVDFLKALEGLDKSQSEKSRQKKLITLLVNMGQPVVIENVGEGQVISKCEDSKVDDFSDDATAVDADVIGMDGCLTYHTLDAVTDKNNPKGVPANNIPDSFRTIVSESLVLQRLVDSYEDQRVFNCSSVVGYLNSLGHGVYSEDDEGVITEQTLTAEDCESFLDDFFSLDLDNWNIEGSRFHTGYNPSGGPTYDCVAEDWGDEQWSTSCYDWSADLLDDCPIDPRRFDFDGEKLTDSDDGAFILQLEWRQGGYLDDAAVIHELTSRPYRDDLYQPVRVKLSDYGMNPETVDSRYCTNYLHEPSLDPLSDGHGGSVPFASLDWRLNYPDMTVSVDNAYRYPAKEVAARHAIVLHRATNKNRLNSLQALSLSRLLVGGMAAVPLSGGTHVIFEDHGKTLPEWEKITDEWLATGTKLIGLKGSSKLEIEDGGVSLKMTQKCSLKDGSKQDCTITANNLLIQTGGATISSGGETTFNVTGTLSVLSDSFGDMTYPVYKLVINPTNTEGFLLGDSDYMNYFKGQDIASKIESGTKMKATLTWEAVREVADDDDDETDEDSDEDSDDDGDSG